MQVGTGDLTSGMFLVKLLQGSSPVAALEHTAAAYQAVMAATLDAGEYVGFAITAAPVLLLA